MMILGIDPGTATTGYAFLEQNTRNKTQCEIAEFGVITTAKYERADIRLRILYEDLSALIKKYRPLCAGVEKLFFTTNQKTAIEVAQARGVVLLVLAQHKIQVIELTPLQVKNYITGYGKAEKLQIQKMMQQTFKLKSLPKPDDAADALAIAYCTSLIYRQK
ncbi:MAG TPA: crossover junction endodeoxyribonuclease RuvC [Patescibacteria group bacterium]|nr:crossover junction endodeoxyribonuclease RuvC [Patescibacteria group bacterium]